jgi:hypothetical protein
MKTSTTTDQLRALMQSHIETVAVPSHPIPEPAVVSTPVAFAQVQTRFSLRLLPMELEKINSIIKTTMQNTGQRITLTDVLRTGLKRMGESISSAEVSALRSSDGRRH